MRFAYFGNFLGHGGPLAEWGTGFVLLLSTHERIGGIDVYCRVAQDPVKSERVPEKVQLREIFDSLKPFSLLNVLPYLRTGDYELIIFNLIPTTFDNKSTSNFIALLLPWITQFLLKKRVVVVYHNSVTTNDPSQLGYNTIYDRVRIRILRILEKIMLSRLDVLVLLKEYKKIIDRVVPVNRVQVMETNYLEGIPTLYLNDQMNSVELIKSGGSAIPRVLLYGFWGPQKDLEYSLTILEEAKSRGAKFHLTLAGGINPHFPGYISYFGTQTQKHSQLIDEFMGYVEEIDLLTLFMKTDLILLCYKSTGGQSGVIEIASILGVDVIGIRFPEYDEKAEMRNTVYLYDKEEISDKVISYLLNFKQPPSTVLEIGKKQAESLSKIMKSLEKFIKSSK